MRIGIVGREGPRKLSSLRGRGLDRNLLSGDREAEGRLFQSVSAQNIASAKLGIRFNYSGLCCGREIPNFRIL